MTVTDYRARRRDDPDDPVEVLYEGAWHEAHIDARRRRDGIWEALVWYSVPRADGNRHGRKDWVTYDQLRQLVSGDHTGSGGVTTREEAIAEAGAKFAASRWACAQMTPREQAEAAWTPTSRFTVDELEARIRARRGMDPASRSLRKP